MPLRLRESCAKVQAACYMLLTKLKNHTVARETFCIMKSVDGGKIPREKKKP